MAERFIIDTNIIIYYLDNKIPDNELNKLEKIFLVSFNISTITKIELLGWQKIDNKIIRRINDFLNNARIYYINKEIEDKSIKIKQESKIAVPDAIIAATALVNNFTIVTRNDKDFYKIHDLRIYNPFISK